MKIFEYIASYTVPFVILVFSVLMMASGRDRVKDFIDGAVNGLKISLHLLPTLVLLLSSIGMLKVSGAFELIGGYISPLLERFNIPAQIVPLLLTRPFSGSASSAMFSTLLEQVGADSFPAMCAAVIMGSSDTAVYVISVYFSSIKVKKTGYALPVSIFIMIFCVLFSCFICSIWFK